MKFFRMLILPVVAMLALAIPSHAQVTTSTDVSKGEIVLTARYNNRIAKDDSKQAKTTVLSALDLIGYAYNDSRPDGDVMVTVNDDNTASITKHMTGAWLHLIINTPFNGTMYFFLPRNFSNDKDCINDSNWKELLHLTGSLQAIFSQGFTNPSKDLLNVVIPQ